MPRFSSVDNRLDRISLAAWHFLSYSALQAPSFFGFLSQSCNFISVTLAGCSTLLGTVDLIGVLLCHQCVLIAQVVVLLKVRGMGQRVGDFQRELHTKSGEAGAGGKKHDGTAL